MDWLILLVTSSGVLKMADLIRAMGAPMGPPVGSPSTESEDGGGDLAELAADLELDEADGPSTNGWYNVLYI